jgi:hypothetical protein
VSIALLAAAVLAIVAGFLFVTGARTVRAASAPQAPAPPALPTAQVVADTCSPLREQDPERERRVGGAVMTLVGFGLILAAFGVFTLALAAFSFR